MSMQTPPQSTLPFGQSLALFLVASVLLVAAIVTGAAFAVLLGGVIVWLSVKVITLTWRLLR